MAEGSVGTASTQPHSATSDTPADAVTDAVSQPSKDAESTDAQQSGESPDYAPTVAAPLYGAEEKAEGEQTAVDSGADSSSSSTSDGGATDDTIPVSVKRYRWTPPNDAARFPYRPHQGEGSQYLRDFILGVNDGLISTFLVVVGVVGGNASTLQALLTGISSAIAGALSMGIGEYIATKSQLQVNEGEKRLESEHFKYHRDVELEQLRQFLTSVNLSGNLLEAVVSEVGRSDDGLMRMMQAFEFGGEEELERNPLRAMWMSGRLFFLGSLPTVIPFFFSISTGKAVAISAALVGVCLFVVGAYKTRTTRGNWLLDGMENLALGAAGAGIAYAVGVAFDKAS